MELKYVLIIITCIGILSTIIDTNYVSTENFMTNRLSLSGKMVYGIFSANIHFDLSYINDNNTQNFDEIHERISYGSCSVILKFKNGVERQMTLDNCEALDSAAAFSILSTFTLIMAIVVFNCCLSDSKIQYCFMGRLFFSLVYLIIYARIIRDDEDDTEVGLSLYLEIANMAFTGWVLYKIFRPSVADPNTEDAPLTDIVIQSDDTKEQIDVTI